MSSTSVTPSRYHPAPAPLLPVAIAVVCGIVADYAVGQAGVSGGLPVWWWIGCLCTLICVALRSSVSARAQSACLLVAIVCVGASWHHVRWNYYEHDHLARFNTVVPQPVCLQAVAIDRLKWSPAPPTNPLRALPVGPRSELMIRVTQVRDGRQWREVSGTCKLRIDGELRDVMVGDRLQVFALMGQLTPALNPGEYDWQLASRGKGQHCEVFCKSPACVTVTEAAKDWAISRTLHDVGRRYERRLATYIRPGQRDLAQAILLGARERLDSNVYDDFVRTGTIHLLVVSGLHVGVLALVIWAVVCSGLLPRQTGLLLTACLVVSYAFVTGGRPPVMRATVIVVLTLLSYLLGKKVSPVNLLSAAVLAVLAISPTEVFRSGTQLSFLCVATLAAYGTLFQREQTIDPLTRLIRNAESWPRRAGRWLLANFMHTALASLAIWLVVAPLVSYHFHISSPISILITPLLWPLVAVALITGLVICFVAWIVPPLAWLLGQICSLCLWATQTVVEAAEPIAGGNFYLPGPTGWWVLVFYVGLLLAAIVFWKRVRWTWQVAAVLLWLAVGLATSATRIEDSRLRCTFLSVGHGTCVVLELPGGETLLYDAGSLGSPDRAAQTIASYLWSRGHARIDGVVLSHADVDHYNALPGLLDRFDIANVYVSPLMFDPWITDGQLDAPNYLQQTLIDANVPLQTVWMNDRLRTSSEQIEIEVLHPPRSGVVGRDNANSLLLAIHYAGKSILLPGDLESPGIEAVTAEQPQSFEILLAPHHGSRNSDPPGFAAWCTPTWVIVSGPRVGRDQQFTAQSYRDVGAQVLHTADVGAVEFLIDGNGIECSQFVTSKD